MNSNILNNFKENSALNTITIELTERCNNDCIHCFINQPANSPLKKKELNTKQIKEILMEAANLGCFNVTFTGGEPLLRSDFCDIYMSVKKLGFDIAIYTNGSLFNYEIFEILSKYPPNRAIQISLYGLSASDYKNATKENNFSKVLKNIGILKERKIPFVVMTSIFEYNLAQLDEYHKFIDEISYKDNNPSFNFTYYKRLKPDPKKNIENIRLDVKDVVNMMEYGQKNYFDEMKVFCKNFTAKPSNILFKCGIGYKSIYIDSYGNIYPCQLLRDKRFSYNINNHLIAEVLKEYSIRFKNITINNEEYQKTCGTCMLLGLCKICPGMSFIEHGVLEKKIDYFCDLAHLQARSLGILSTGEYGWKIKNWDERINNFVEKNNIVK